MNNQTVENNIELRKAEKPSQYLSRITRVDTEADFYVELEEDSEDVYEIVAGGEVVGLAYIDDDEEAFVYVFIFKEHRGKGYSYPAALAAEKAIKASPVRSIQTGYDANNALAKKLAEKCGYAPQFASAIMRYGGAKLEEKALPIRAYRDEDFTSAYTLTDEAFHRMHLETGLFPDSKLTPPTDKERKFWSDTAAERFVYEKDGEIVACGRICKDALSFVAVDSARRGEGFGRGMVTFLTNRLIEKNGGEPRLWCVVGNDRARKLYESLGYRETDRAEYSKKFFVRPLDAAKNHEIKHKAIRLVKVDNCFDLAELELDESRLGFAAPNQESTMLACGTLCEGKYAQAFGIYDGETPVGFAMIGHNSFDFDGKPAAYEHSYYIRRLMIDKAYRRQGYGRDAMKLLIEHILTFPDGEESLISTSYEQENEGSKRLCLSMGFVPNGEYCGSEEVVVLRLK